jgi:hypothetical protein
MLQALSQTFSDHLGLSTEASTSVLLQPLPQLLSSPEVSQLLSSLNTTLLKETLPTAGAVLAQQLPAFYEWLQTELNLQRVPDSPDHTTKWVVGFLNNQESLERLVELHHSIPKAALERAIPRLVKTFDGVEPVAVQQEWQRAIALLCLVLTAAKNHP